jgi:hypothetical protein
MNFIQEYYLPIFGILLFLIVIEGLIIYLQYKEKRKRRRKGKSSNTVSKEKYNDIMVKLKASRDDVVQLKSRCGKVEKEYKDLYIKYSQIDEKHDKACLDINKYRQTIDELKETIKELEQKIRDLTRDKEGPNKMPGNEPAPNVTETMTMVDPASTVPESEQKEEPENNDSSTSSTPSAQDVASDEIEQKENEPKEDPKPEPSVEETNTDLTKDKPKVGSPKEKTMYASFPRSAGSSIYFSDLSVNLLDDSHFELTISIASGKATFKPLNFMKIRNYDPAMAAMRTEGVKPNVASTVIGIEPGKANVEGKDWIIDNLAKIKLA